MQEPIDSRQLRAFVLLARSGSFTLAAKELSLSQSAVSHSMKALERQVGCRLLDRLGRKVVLTQAGEQLLMHADKILQEMENARSSLQELGRWGRARLRVAASTTACEHILPTVLREFKESFPQCSILIEPGDTPDAIEMLRTGRVDLALVLRPRQEDQLAFHPLFTDELVFVTDPLHPWAVAGKVERSDLPRQNYILYNKTSYTFAMVAEYFRQEEMVLNTIMELGSMNAIKELVKLGLGVSILSPWIVWNELAERSLVMLPLGRRRLLRQWGILHWKGRRLSLPEETFVGLCRSVAENMAQQFRSPHLIPVATAPVSGTKSRR